MSPRVIMGEWPPNIDQIAHVMPQAKTTRGVYFAYAPHVYSPGGFSLTPALLAHEAVHIERQAAMGPESWWGRYLADPEFRFYEELLAHRAEYRHHADKARHRNERRFYLTQVAQRLAGRLYGGMCSLEKAKKLIRGNDGDG